MNTFQAVLASDDTDSYALFFYPEEGLQFFGTRPKTGTGTELPARVGFSRGWISASEDHDYVFPEQSIRNLHRSVCQPRKNRFQVDATVSCLRVLWVMTLFSCFDMSLFPLSLGRGTQG